MLFVVALLQRIQSFMSSDLGTFQIGESSSYYWTQNGIVFIAEQLEEDNLVLTNVQPSPKHTMSEKWIMDHQKKKFLEEQKLVFKQQKTKQRIATCFYKLKVCA